MSDANLPLPPGGKPEGDAFRWEPADQPAAVLIAYDVVDRLGAEVMRGYGAVPKRGAEVGGILLGAVERSDPATVRIQDFVLVPTEYRWGPSYLLSEKDQRLFEEELSKAGRSPERLMQPVGYFRSHTRDPLQLTAEDIWLLDARFPDDSAVCLLIRPHSTRPSEAAFFFRDQGHFRRDPPELLLPFRRRDLGGGKPPRRRLADEGLEAGGEEQSQEAKPADRPRGPASLRESAESMEARPSVAQHLHVPVSRRSWLRALPGFSLLVFGIVAGMQIAVRFFPEVSRPPLPDPVLLLPMHLSASDEGEGIVVHWNMPGELERKAREGVLSIEDGLNRATIDLTRADLLRGAVTYRHSSSSGKVTLEIRLNGNGAVSESATWARGERTPAL